MITTVIISSVTASGAGLGMALGLVAVIALAVFLCVRELAAASGGSNRRFLAGSLNVAIVPLVIAFVMIVAMKVVDIIA